VLSVGVVEKEGHARGDSDEEEAIGHDLQETYIETVKLAKELDTNVLSTKDLDETT